MNLAEALEFLNKTKVEPCEYGIDCENCPYECKFHQFAEIVRKAIEKQIKKKPKEEWCKSQFSDDKGCLFQHLMCPNCEKMEVNKLDSFCPHCGQAISWDGEGD